MKWFWIVISLSNVSSLHETKLVNCMLSSCRCIFFGFNCTQEPVCCHGDTNVTDKHCTLIFLPVSLPCLGVVYLLYIHSLPHLYSQNIYPRPLLAYKCIPFIDFSVTNHKHFTVMYLLFKIFKTSFYFKFDLSCPA